MREERNERESRYLSRIAAARYLSVSPRMLDKLLASGQIAAGRCGRRVLIAPEDLDAFFQSTRTQPVATSA